MKNIYPIKNKKDNTNKMIIVNVSAKNLNDIISNNINNFSMVHNDIFSSSSSKSVSVLKRTPTKRALLIGLNYQNTGADLSGCETDILHMKTILINNFLYKEENIVVVFYRNLSVSKGVIEFFKEFIENSIENDELFFHYSGHGTSVRDNNRDENDGKDEAIVGYRLQKILDDDLNKILYKLPKNIVMTMIFDSCYSGTVVDLKYSYNELNRVNIESRLPDIKNNYIISISGCRDNQVSEESNTPIGVQGVLTRSLIKIIKDEPIEHYNWKILISRLRQSIKNQGFKQVPIISFNDTKILALNIKDYLI